jgi:hypothetical protein
MCQVLINYDSSICTNIINYTPHVCSNSSTTCLNHVPNLYLNQNPSSISSSKYDLLLCDRPGVYDHIPIMNKDMKLIHNVLQCVLCNSSRYHYLEPLRKRVMAKMAHLVEFRLILESNLVECASHRIFIELI